MAVSIKGQRLDPVWCRCGRIAIYGDRCENCWAEDQARYDGKVTRRARIEREVFSCATAKKSHFRYERN